MYLDHNATTPVDDRVVSAMSPFLAGQYGNPSSLHHAGRVARAAVDQARQQVAELVNAHPEQVIFTGGGTEANNLAVKGLLACTPAAHFAVSAVEHASLLEPARALVRHGWYLHSLDVDRNGMVDPSSITALQDVRPRLISVMLANNETGVVQPLAQLAAEARRLGAVVHSDAVQAAGKLDVDYQALGVQLLSLSAHKLYGPKGVGALVVDRNLELEPLFHGGGHESGYRAGTENVAGIVGFGAAAELARRELEQRTRHVKRLRERLELKLGEIDGLSIVAGDVQRLPNTVMFSVSRISGETLLMQLDRDGIAVSSGSACDSHQQGPSHVLAAMGVDVDTAQNSIRVSLGKDNTVGEIDSFVARLKYQIDRTTGLAVSAWV